MHGAKGFGRRTQVTKDERISALGEYLRGALPDALRCSCYDRNSFCFRHDTHSTLVTIPTKSRPIRLKNLPHRTFAFLLRTTGNSNPRCYTPPQRAAVPLFAAGGPRGKHRGWDPTGGRHGIHA